MKLQCYGVIVVGSNQLLYTEAQISIRLGDFFFLKSLGAFGVRRSTLHLVKGVSAVAVSQLHFGPNAKPLQHVRGLQRQQESTHCDFHWGF